MRHVGLSRRRERAEHLLRAGARLDGPHFHPLGRTRVGAERPDLLRDAVIVGQFRPAVDAPIARHNAEVEHLTRNGVAAARDLYDQRRHLRTHDSCLPIARHDLQRELVQAWRQRRRIAAEQAEHDGGNGGGRERAVSHGVAPMAAAMRRAAVTLSLNAAWFSPPTMAM